MMKKDKTIIKNEGLEDIVFDYHPKTFPVVLTSAAAGFLSSQGEETSDFKISDLVANQRGIADMQRRGVEDKIEELALQKVKEIEEKAYQEAYTLGLIEGSEKSFSEKKEELEGRLNQLDDLLKFFGNIKKRLLADNERQLMELLVQTAGKLALREIESDPESILKTLEMVLEDIHKDENVTIYLSQQDHDFLDQLRTSGNKRGNELKHVKLEVAGHIRPGGCQVETNYGVIDSTLEQRVEKVMSAMYEKMPRVKKDQSK